MERAPSAGERRGGSRAVRRLACEISHRGRRQPAVIVDLSHTGLFVRTNVLPEPGSSVEVLVRRPGGEAWTIQARVARSTEGSASQPLFTARGVGLVIEEAPEAFRDFIRSLG